MGKVINLFGEETSPNDLINEAAKNEFEEVLIIGKTTDGQSYLASSSTIKRDIVYLIEDLKFQVLAGVFDADV